MENFKMVAKTFFGFEEILAKEVQQFRRLKMCKPEHGLLLFPVIKVLCIKLIYR
jgi:hypothetical protein